MQHIAIGQSPPSDQPDQNKQQSTGFLITSLSWLKFYKSSKFYRIGTSASSLKQTKIITNCIENYVPNITKHYPQTNLCSPGVNGAGTPEID